MSKGRILVADDEQPMRSFIVRNLEARGYEAIGAASGFEALALLQKHDPDLVILDVMMPSMDGLETCERIRQRSIVPILVVTALGEERDRVRALDAGADDCLVKPFGVSELLARVAAALRRAAWTSTAASPRPLKYRDLILDPEAGVVTFEGDPLTVTGIEYRLLDCFLSNPGKVLPHDQLLRTVWGPEYGDEAEYLRVYVGRLRRKLGDDARDPTYIHTERGLGYRFGK
ncbi:MAG: response regulator transcription factor [Actinomycetia bacterium]|nr:response regulator transcription factor [Actinomycetes bacterium]